MKADQILNKEQRRATYIEAQKLWLHDMPGMVFCFKSILHGVSKRVQGFAPDPRYTQDFRSVSLS
jgi:ABC-type transport system substrate-binding protein